MVKKVIKKTGKNIVNLDNIKVPKLIGKEILSEIKNYRTIQYQFKFDEPVSVFEVKKFVLSFSIRTKETLIR